VVGDPEIATRINSFEMAYRMQATAPELMDLAKEPKHILDLYGVEPGKANFASGGAPGPAPGPSVECVSSRFSMSPGISTATSWPT
jgi:hypothetical protein